MAGILSGLHPGPAPARQQCDAGSFLPRSIVQQPLESCVALRVFHAVWALAGHAR